MKSISRREFVGAASVLAAGLGLVGCGGSSDSSSSSSDSKVETIKARGTLEAGVKQDVVGYGMLNTSTNEYEGLEIDLCYQIAAKIFDVTYDEAKEKKLVNFTAVTPKTRGPLIDNDTLDIIAATYTITDERKESWDFSDPYRTDYVGILIKKDSGMSTMADLDGKTIGVSQGSTTKDKVTDMLAEQAPSAAPTFSEYPDYTSINSALDAGQIDAFAMDRSTLNTYTTDDKELLQPEIEFGAQDYGVATKKDSDLSAVVNEVVTDCLSNGWLDEEVTKWGLL